MLNLRCATSRFARFLPASLVLAVLASCSGGGGGSGGGNSPGGPTPDTPPPSQDVLASCMKGKTQSQDYQDAIKAYQQCGGKPTGTEFAKFMEAHAKVSTKNGKLAVELK